MFLAVIVFDIIQCNGILIFNGDFFNQTIPFTYHIYDRLRTFGFGWDMSSGLGEDFLTSYAYYNLFSPFTLLYLPLPRNIIIYAIPYITALKYGTGTMLAYFWIRRFVKDPHFAVIGGMVYMFSSFSAYNEIFHFIDVTALFPLFMIAMDELCENGRKGVFALTAALMALTNYYFFFGQAVFAVLYFLCRYIDKDIKASLKRLALTAAEAVIGVLMSCAVLLPVAYALLNSPKATDIMSVQDMLLYNSLYKYLHILHSVFSVPDGFKLITIFPETDNIYPFGLMGASVAAYIPFFSAAGVISYFFSEKRVTWEKKLIAACVIFAFVPVLNQTFSGLNSGLYMRWYYMPILLGAMISVRALEDGISFRKGIAVCGIALAALVIYGLFFFDEDKLINSSVTAVYNPPLRTINIAVAVLSLIILALSVRSKRDKEFIPKVYIMSFVCIYMSFGIMSFYNLTGFAFDDKRSVVDIAAVNETLPEFVKETDMVASTDLTDNYQLVWGFESPLHFNSIYDPGFEEFLMSNGLSDSGGLYESITPDHRELCDLLSVKHFLMVKGKGNFDAEDKEADFGMYEFYGNKNYIPLGYTYDLMISGKRFAEISSPEEKQRAYMKYLVVENADELSDVLELCDDTYSPPDDEQYAGLVERHRAECAHDTSVDSGGIGSDITLARENIVFYAVSYNNGWSAYVDGAHAELYKVDNGLIGVRVPAGTHHIELKYKTPLGTEGAVVSLVGLAVYAVYIGVNAFLVKSKRTIQ